jgi:conjugal transfer/entry exclusion protein
MDNNALNKVDQIQDLLNDEQTMLKVKNLMDSLTSGSESTNDTTSNNSSDLNFSQDFLNGKAGDIQNFLKIKNVLDVVSNDNDKNITLINALKPFLSTTRKSKAAKCINFIQISKLTKLLKSKNGLGDLFNGRS